jgi:hypothetical protein
LVKHSLTLVEVGEGECRELGAVVTLVQTPDRRPLTLPRLSACSAKTRVALSFEGEEIIIENIERETS